jgi:hypothetical protein
VLNVIPSRNKQYLTSEKAAINHREHSGTKPRNRIQEQQPEAAIRNRLQEPDSQDNAR